MYPNGSGKNEKESVVLRDLKKVGSMGFVYFLIFILVMGCCSETQAGM